MATIHPQSCAGVLLREFDTPAQAAEYAERKQRFLSAMPQHSASTQEYAEAAKLLRSLAPQPASAP